MSHLLAIAVGPVQEFIAAARRTRDLWFGGKTTSGYGRFDGDKWKAEEDVRQIKAEQGRIAAENEAKFAAMSPIERSIKEFLESHPNKNEKRDWFKLFDELKKPDARFASQEDRIECARRIKAGMQADKVWKG